MKTEGEENLMSMKVENDKLKQDLEECKNMNQEASKEFKLQIDQKDKLIKENLINKHEVNILSTLRDTLTKQIDALTDTQKT